jgi:tetratricopeptide (TPR) repeat protein
MYKDLNLLVRVLFLPGLLVLVVTACNNDGGGQMLPPGVEAISMLGDTLYTPELPDHLRGEYQANLERAVNDYRLDPEDIDAIIWLGRRLAYLGQFREAIGIFTEGIFKYPEEPRFYRHRGHRYITLRMLDQAISDLETAADMMRNTSDEAEPDGLSNESGSTLHANVWYHLGLAHYLRGDYQSAIEAYRHCLNRSKNDDMLVATLYWYYMAERRAGNDERAGRLLELVDSEMNIFENENHHLILLVFKGVFDADKLIETGEDALQNATVGYGIGNWHYVNGRTDRALTIWNEVLDTDNWPVFGFIAAESEIARGVE